MDDGLIFQQSIIGKTEENGWTIIEYIAKKDNATGGAYSKCYKVEKNGELGFMKVYDLQSYLKDKPASQMAEIQKRMLRHFTYEQDLHRICSDGYFDKVCYAIAAGALEINIIPGVDLVAYYLIFAQADGDMNRKFDSLEISHDWKFRMLHNTAVAMKQLYTGNIYHQDIKPSNILCFPNNEFKVGDLGRSYTSTQECPFSSEPYWGDKRYMAPEISYQAPPVDLNYRAQMTDLYLFGSLIYHSFSGMCYNASLYGALNKAMHPGGSVTYTQALPVMQELHFDLTNQFKEILPFSQDVNERLTACVFYLCNPDYNLRRHPTYQNKEYHHLPNLERLITTFDYLEDKMKHKTLTEKCR